MLPFQYASAQAGSVANLEDTKKAIPANNEIYFQAFVKNDASIFVNPYAKDCWIMPPNAPALCGPDARVISSQQRILNLE